MKLKNKAKKENKGEKRLRARGALKCAGKWAIFCVVILCCMIPCLFMNSVYGYFAALFVLALSLLSLICLLIEKSSLKLTGDISDIYIERGKDADVSLTLVNNSLLACPKATATMFTADSLGEAEKEEDVRFTIAGKEKVKFSFGTGLSHIGVYDIGISH